MSTARFCQLIDMPERTWRRWQANQRAGYPAKGPWPQPARDAARELILKHATKRPAWEHRKIWAMVRHDGHVVSEATVLRALRNEGLILPVHYQRERRKLAERRKAAFANDPTGPNQVWQLDFSEFETTAGGTWRLAGCRDYWSKYEYPFHVSPTANQHDAIDAVELALVDYEAMFGHRLVDLCPVDEDTGELLGGGHHRHRQRRPVPLDSIRGVHRTPPRTRTRPHPSEITRPERVTRTRIRHAEIREALPRRDRRRRHARQTHRGIPHRKQPDQTT